MPNQDYDREFLACGWCNRDIEPGTAHIVLGETADAHVLYCSGHCPKCNDLSLFDVAPWSTDVVTTGEYI